MLESSKDFWLNPKRVKAFYDIETSERQTLQPYIAAIIKKINPNTLLDYGCGDGYIHTKINKSIKKYLYDINKDSLLKVSEYLKPYYCRAILDESKLPINFFDCVLLSLVLVCVENENEQKKILENIRRSKKANGRLIFVSTHPCFRQYAFRPVHTSFNHENFNYMQNGLPFTVFMNDKKDKETEISFTDYHTSMSYSINQLIEAGFAIEEMIEFKDAPLFKGDYFNSLFPPFFALICK
jgi:ubiquinone/menaquinone biosynthesis C-methylase UbiE